MSMTSAPTLHDVRALIGQMLQSPSDQVRLAASLRDMVAQLGPGQARLQSRVDFDRAALYALCANFFDLTDAAEERSETIRIPHDMWIRGVHAFCLPSLQESTVEADGILLTAEQRRRLLDYGTNWRGLFEVSWRLNAKQGFITDGHGELMVPAASVTGDGERMADLDWQLEREDTIVVRCRNRIRRIFPTDCVTALGRTLPWIVVAFWGERLR